MDPDLGWTRKTYDHLTERKTAQDLQLKVPPERSPSEDATRSSAQSYRKMRAWMEREVGAAKERTETLEEQLRIARREIAATSDEAQLVREDAEAAEARAEVALSLQKNVRWQ
ncbi:hypothetical protein CYMTET_38401 [Cymbomonas tetramitiformis]|uniref:Uncharacterized protein n=1 Tax=Cymbomonas tetramitiformis TaxID=36881 RepID=A0AAE0CC44_9CHLO|nr:hypothetical protein CYMTET_38401 [Cymbomonas tetramitiformis]